MKPRGCGFGRWSADRDESTVRSLERRLNSNLVSMSLWKEVDEAVIRQKDYPSVWISIQDVEITGFVIKSSPECPCCKNLELAEEKKAKKKRS